MYQGASLSADSMANALAFLTIAYFAYWIYGPENPIRRREIVLIFLLTLSLSCTKNVFFLASFLYLLIPSHKFINKKSYWFVFFALVTTNIAVCFAWYQIVKNMPITWKPDILPDQQIVFILTHPAAYIKTFLVNFSGQIERNARAFVGLFGWTDTMLPRWHFKGWAFVLLFTILTDGCKKHTIKWIDKVLYLSIFSMIYVLIVTLLYIYWNPVGADKIAGVQGRYFIPMAPLFFLCLYNRRLRCHSFIKSTVLSVSAVLSLTLALYVFYNRFYVLSV